MAFADLPPSAAWRHGTSRIGVESTSFESHRDGWLAVGSTTALERGSTWWVAYEIELDSSFVTRRARVSARTGCAAPTTTLIEHDGRGRWSIDGRTAPELDGCLDIDLESSAMTNALPMRRLSLAIGQQASAPAAWVRVQGTSVERLEQHYLRREDLATGPTLDYAAPDLDFGCRITYDPSGLVLNYPGIADRIG